MEPTNIQSPLVTVYVLLVRNPLIQKTYGTLLKTTSLAKIKEFQNHPNYNGPATQLKVRKEFYRSNKLPADLV